MAAAVTLLVSRQAAVVAMTAPGSCAGCVLPSANVHMGKTVGPAPRLGHPQTLAPGLKGGQLSSMYTLCSLSRCPPLPGYFYTANTSPLLGLSSEAQDSLALSAV